MAKRSSRKAAKKAHTEAANQLLFGVPKQTEPSPNWAELNKTYPGHPALVADTIYSLPPALIDALVEEQVGFLTTEAERFERDLARLSDCGFIQGRQISYPLMRRPGPKQPSPKDDLSERLDAVDARIVGLEIEMMTGAGATGAQIDQHYELAASIKERVEERQAGYVGWLATDPLFRQERDAFRAKWGGKIVAAGTFPSIPVSYLGERPPSPPEPEREFYNDYRLFYANWGLERLATWELPVPMRPQLTAANLYHDPSSMGAGLSVFAPWYLLRDPGFDLHELGRYHMQTGAAQRIQPWMNREPKNWGYERFAVMQQLHVYLTLGIEQRYAGQLRRQTGRLDRAFTRFLFGEPVGDTDNVRKIRLEMKRRLRPTPDDDS